MKGRGWMLLAAAALLLGAVGGAYLIWGRRLLSKPASLTVSSTPGGAEVSVDDKPMGTTPCGLNLAAGTYRITLRKEHASPWTRQVTILAQPVHVEASLRLEPYVVAVSQGAAFAPAWRAGGLLYCAVDGSDQLGVWRLPAKAQSLSPVSGLPGQCAQPSCVWTPQADRLLVRCADPNDSQQGRWLSFLVDKGGWTDLGGANPTLVSALAVAWSADGERLAYLLSTRPPAEGEGSDVAYDGPQPAELWTCAADGSSPHRVATWDNATAVTWAPRSDCVAVESGALGLSEGRIWLVALADGQRVAIPAQGASGAVWSDDGQWLVMRALGPAGAEAEGLWICDANGGQLQRIAPDSPLEYHWLPGTHQVVYFTTPAQGGASCWSVDVDMGNRVLLADAAILPQEIGEFAIAPDGQRIAFVGSDGALHLLVLGE